MNFLKMAQEVRHLSGVQGTGPSSVSTTGYDKIFLTTVNDVWREIQTSKKTWKWMRASTSFLMTTGVTTYLPATILGPVNRFKGWYQDTLYITKDGKKSLARYVNYEVFTYRHINDTENKPVHLFTVRPSDNALIFTLPDAAYAVQIDYHKNAQELELATDTPEFSTDYHRIIVNGATASYASSMSMANIQQEYSQKFVEGYDQLVREQIPREIFKVSGIV